MRLTVWRDPAFEWHVSRALLVIAWLICAAVTLTERVDRDEHMYLAAASLSAERQLYEDFAFLQTPYSVGVYRVVSAFSPGNWTLLPARIFKILLTAAMIAVLFALLRRLGARPLLAATLVTLLYQDQVIRDMAGIARNYDLARISVLGAMLILPLRANDPVSRVRLAGIGALAAAAVGFKLTYAPLALLLLVWPLVVETGNRLRQVRWLGLGALAGIAPLIVTVIGVDPDVLRSSLLDYHYTNAEFHVLEGYEPYATIWDRLARTAGTILSPEHRPLSAMVVFALALNLARWSRPRTWIPGPRVRLVLAFMTASLVIAAVPRPLQGSYFAPAFFGLTMFVAAATARLTRRGANTMLALCLMLAAVVGIWTASETIALFRDASNPSRWTGVISHRSGVELATLRVDDLPVLTTHPIFALEGGCALYPELATGEFAWRAGALLGPRRRELLNSVSAETLESLLRDRPPGAVVTEIDGPWDQPLVDWAASRHWNETVLADPEIRAWTP